MKNNVFFIVLLLLSSTFVGCSDKEAENEYDREDTSVNSSETFTEESSSETNEDKNVSINTSIDTTTVGELTQSEETTTKISEAIKTEITTTAVIVENPDFRNVKWGMTAEEVMASESNELMYNSESMLVYKNKNIAGVGNDLVYFFDDSGKLWRSVYSFNDTHTNKNLYISDYDDIVEALTQKYGKPNDNETYWLNDLFREDYDNYGLAISIGDLVYQAEWATENTDIWINLSGDNYDISLNLYYDSKTYVKSDNSNDVL